MLVVVTGRRRVHGYVQLLSGPRLDRLVDRLPVRRVVVRRLDLSILFVLVQLGPRPAEIGGRSNRVRSAVPDAGREAVDDARIRRSERWAPVGAEVEEAEPVLVVLVA